MQQLLEGSVGHQSVRCKFVLCTCVTRHMHLAGASAACRIYNGLAESMHILHCPFNSTIYYDFTEAILEALRLIGIHSTQLNVSLRTPIAGCSPFSLLLLHPMRVGPACKRSREHCTFLSMHRADLGRSGRHRVTLLYDLSAR